MFSSERASTLFALQQDEETSTYKTSQFKQKGQVRLPINMEKSIIKLKQFI